MGKLQDMADQRNIKSMRKLAAAMKGSAGSPWPREPERSENTIATKLAELDRGKDVEWWWGTGAMFRPALAFALGVELAALEPLRARDEPDGDPHLFTFSDFPELRPLSLLLEDPFPGVPAELTKGRGPSATRTWWVAPPGAGKQLVARWLEQRFGWQLVTGRTWADVADQLPMAGRVFLILESAEGAAQLIEAASDELRLCVACPEAPPEAPTPPSTQRDGLLRGLASIDQGRAGAGPGSPSAEWRIVEMAPPDSWIEALIRWTGARIEPGGGFNAAAQAEVLGWETLAELVETPGDALGLFRVIDEVGLPNERSGGELDPKRWISAWVKTALERAGDASPIGKLLIKRGAELFIDLCKARFCQGLPAVLSPSQWATLVPTLSEEPDRLALLKLIERGGDDLRAKLIEALAPAPTVLLDALQRLGAIGAGPDPSPLRPLWLATMAENVAVDDHHHGTASELGALLLQPETVEPTLVRMFEDVKAGRDCVCRRGLEAELRSPEGAAALDGALRALGIAASLGAEIDLQLAKELLVLQAPMLVARFINVPPTPLICVGISENFYPSPKDGWYLAMLELSRRLGPAAADLVPPALSPWSPTFTACHRDAEQLNTALSWLSTAANAKIGPWRTAGWWQGALRMGGHLLEALGPPTDTFRSLDIRLPALLAKATLGELVDPKTLQDLLSLEFGLDALDDACRQKGTTLSSALDWCWGQWTARSPDHNCTPIRWLNPDRNRVVALEDQRALWEAVPPDALSPEWCRFIAKCRLPVPWLSREVWARVLRELTDPTQTIDPMNYHDYGDAYSAAPIDLLFKIFDGIAPSIHCSPVHPILWRRDEAATLAKAVSLMNEGDAAEDLYGNLAHLCRSAPRRAAPALIEHIGRWLSPAGARPQAKGWVWRWLLDVVEQRGPGWRAAYALFDQHRAAMVEALNTPV